MFDPEKIITLYFAGDEVLTQADVDQLSEWIGQSQENAVEFIRASFTHRAIHDFLGGEDLKKNILLDLGETTNGGYNAVIDSSVSLRGIDVDSLTVEEKSKCTPYPDMNFWQEVLQHEKTAPAVEVPKVKPPRELIQKVVYPPQEKRKISKFQIFTLITSAAAVLFVIAFVKIEPLLRPARIEVATLADQTGAQWARLDSGETLQAGVRLRSHEGPFWLQKGTALIRFDYGTEVIVEGPAEFELIDEEKMAINSGRLYATIPGGAVGFTTVTPSATIIDLGTEFGVKVDVDGSSDVHMFKGKASLVPGQAGQKKTGISLSAGQAKSVSIDGRVNDIHPNASTFVKPAQYQLMSKADKGSAYHRWLLYSYELRKDPSLVAYYTFDNEAESSGMLLNRAVGTAGKLNGTLGDEDPKHPEHGPTWETGRWPQKECLKFDRSKFQHIVIPHDPSLTMDGQISMAFWLFLEDQSSGGHLLSKRIVQKGISNSDIEYQAAIFGEIGSNPEHPKRNKMQFGAGLYPGEALNYTDPINWPLGQWHHLVITFDGKTVTYYLDGRLVSTLPHVGTMIRCTEPLRIGTDWPGGDPVGFDGLMGELAIFKRVLLAGEIRQMYEAGKP